MLKLRNMLITLIVVCVTSVLFSPVAMAITDGEWDFKILNNEVTITGYSGAGGTVVIPSHIYNTPVTAVEGTSIFSNVKEITFPGSVREIGPFLFNKSYENNKVLETVVLNEGTEKIGSDAFHSCAVLKNITLPSTVNSIDGGYYKGAFQGTVALETINFPASITSIGRYAFSGSGLKTANLSEVTNLTSIQSDAFKSCENLETIILNNGLKTIGMSTFGGCLSLTNVMLPNTLTTIEDNGFDGCSALKRIILPTSLKSIGEYSFCNCSSLVELVIPYGTETIGDGMCQGCPALQSIYIPDSVVHLPRGKICIGSDDAIVYCSDGSETSKYCKKIETSYLTDSSVNSGITVLYNDRRISFHAYGQNPIVLQDRTLVPLRSIFEAMKADVTWNDATNTATAIRGSDKIAVQIGANLIYKNGEEIAIDVPAQLVNDRTMIPVRVIAEAFGAQVEWNSNGNAVLINEN